MRELTNFRPDYLVREQDRRCPDAHRIVRNAVAIAGVLHSLPHAVVMDAMDAVERAENFTDGEHLISPQDASALATALDSVSNTLASAIDMEWRPHGEASKDIVEEAHQPSTMSDGTTDFDRVFELTSDGRLALRYPRISLPELVERLPEVATFLRQASVDGRDIVLDD